MRIALLTRPNTRFISWENWVRALRYASEAAAAGAAIVNGTGSRQLDSLASKLLPTRHDVVLRSLDDQDA